MNGSVDSVIERIAAAAKYRNIHADTIADVVRQHSARGVDRANLERQSRLTLHRVAALYLQPVGTGQLTKAMRGVGGSPGELRAFCQTAMRAHFSSAERLPELDRFYSEVLRRSGPVATIADIACALTPFSLPWLRDVTDARYVGHDLNLAYVELGNAFFARWYPDCAVEHRDVVVTPSEVTADLALLLKTYHMIEDRMPGAALRMVDRLPCRVIAVSFPPRTMTGRPARFTPRLIAGLSALAGERGWRVEECEFATERLVFVHKTDLA